MTWSPIELFAGQLKIQRENCHRTTFVKINLRFIKTPAVREWMFISAKVRESGHQSLASSIKYPGAQKSPRRRHIIY